jgi:hypothetical protein
MEEEMKTMVKAITELQSLKISLTDLTEDEQKTYANIRRNYIKVLGTLDEFVPIDVGLIQEPRIGRTDLLRVACSKKYRSASPHAKALHESMEAFQNKLTLSRSSWVESLHRRVFRTRTSNRKTVVDWILLTKEICNVISQQLEQICTLQRDFAQSDNLELFMEKCTYPLLLLNQICKDGYPPLL